MKKILAIGLSMIMSMSILACGQQNTKETEKLTEVTESAAVQENETESEKTEQNGPRTITDMLGRTVELPEKIDTIAAINSAARFVTYAGAADKLIGVTDLDKEGQPGMPYAYVNKDHFANLASTGSGGSGDTTYVEELVKLNPDLIFAYTGDTAALDDVTRQTGIPVVGLYATDMFAQDFKDSLTMVGSIMGTEAQAAKVVYNS